MNAVKKINCAVVLTAALHLSAFGQGPLSPSGAPAPTMKTLAQVEPRTAIVSNSFTITQPGSYYLTTNMTGTINIQTGDVTLDLMGFLISSSGDNIVFSGAHTNVVIRNGSLKAPGYGIYCNYASANARMLLENLRIQQASPYGMFLPSGSVVRNCELYGCSTRGIYSSGAVDVRNCILEGNGTGLYLGSGSQVIGNTIRNNTGTGIQLTGTNSYVSENVVVNNADNYNFSAGNRLNLLLSQIPETLDRPCSVKLAGSLTCPVTVSNGITVSADDVTIDMAGHTLTGPGASSGSGIYQSSLYRNLRISNGKVVHWRGDSRYGIYAAGSSVTLSDLQASTNYHGIYTGSGSTLSGCAASENGSYGIFTESGSTLSDCAVYFNGQSGIFAGYGNTLSDCAAYSNGDDGINTGDGSTLSDCAAYSNGDDGIYASYGSTISGCAAYDNGDDGINADSGCTLSGCSVRHNTGDGIQVYYGTQVSGNSCSYNGNNGDGAGIHAIGGDNRIVDNNCIINDRGMDVDASGNFIARNTCSIRLTG